MTGQIGTEDSPHLSEKILNRVIQGVKVTNSSNFKDVKPSLHNADLNYG